MKKLEVKIFENFRQFDDPGVVKFKTDLQCRSCLEVTGNYILIEGWIRVCKGCLGDWIKRLDSNYMEYVGQKEREEK